MSGISHRLQRYGAFPRVRSNSLTTLAVTQPSSSSRPVLSSPPRLPSEGPKQSQHSQLALTQPPHHHPPLFPCTPPLSPNYNPSPTPATSACTGHTSHRAAKRPRLKYQLDVGAYGISKHRTHSSRSHTSSYPHTTLSVQVGEDAYFVRDNAMGIADGVGGWARSVPSSSAHPTPSALFSRRLMHFCSAEIDALTIAEPAGTDPTSSSAGTSGPRPPTAQFSFEHHLKPPVYDAFSFSELEDSLQSSLEELSEGLDVLQILERAYDSTVKAHLAPSSTPLTTGSSTALLAVLDHPSSGPHPLPQSPEAPQRNYAVGSVNILPIPTTSVSPATTSQNTPSSEGISLSAPEGAPNDATSDGTTAYDAVIRIAHLGDCMGMLVRGDAIVWRSDEMWWGYNHPLQLGPPATCSNTPAASADPTEPLRLPVQPHTFTLPVRADDILILASDGLSDNLWDEDVLDEVLKFRRKEGWGFTLAPTDNLETAFASLNIIPEPTSAAHILRRKAFAGMLSEALCSRAKRVSERRPSSSLSTTSSRHSTRTSRPTSTQFSTIAEEPTFHGDSPVEKDEIPFARRARLAGKVFRGGKHDDISVIVAVISPSSESAAGEEKKADEHRRAAVHL